MEVEVFVRSQAYIEAALSDNQSSVEDCAMNHQGRIPGKGLERSTGDLGGEADRTQPACRTDHARAAIRNLRAQCRFEFGEHLGNESSLDRSEERRVGKECRSRG